MTQGAAEITAFKASIAAGKSMGSTLSAMDGFLVATPAGPILKIIGTAITGAAIITDVTKDSYQAGKVVEKEFEARYHGDAEESAEYVLRYGGEHRAESLLRQGRGQDGAALKALAIYNITPADLETTPDSELRAKIIKYQGVGTKNIGMKIGRNSHGLDPATLEKVTQLLQPQSYYQALKADHARKLKQVQVFGPGASISAPSPPTPPS